MAKKGPKRTKEKKKKIHTNKANNVTAKLSEKRNKTKIIL